MRALAGTRRGAHGRLEPLERRVGPGDDSLRAQRVDRGRGRLRGRERRHARPAIELREGRLLRRGGRLGLLLALGEGEETRRVLQARRAHRRVGRRERHGAGPAQIEQRPGERHAIRLDRGRVLPGREQPLGEPERDERVIADDGARGLELAGSPRRSPCTTSSASASRNARSASSSGPSGSRIRVSSSMVRRASSGAPAPAHAVLQPAREKLRRRALPRGVRRAARPGRGRASRLPRAPRPAPLRGAGRCVCRRRSARRDAMASSASPSSASAPSARATSTRSPSASRTHGVLASTRPRAPSPTRDRPPPPTRGLPAARARPARPDRLSTAGRSAPERRRAGVLALAIEQIGQVAERPRVVGPLAQQQRELVARLAHAAEPLLEDGRASQADRPEHLARTRVGLRRSARTREVFDQLVVASARDDERLDGVIRLLVLGVERRARGSTRRPRPRGRRAVRARGRAA